MYYIMALQFAEPLLAKYPKAAGYDKDDNNEPRLILTGEMPQGFDGEVVDIGIMGFGEDGLSEVELIAMVDSLKAQEATGRLVIVSNAQGKYLYANHHAFMPEVSDEVA
jgi:hypothetical protein